MSKGKPASDTSRRVFGGDFWWDGSGMGRYPQRASTKVGGHSTTKAVIWLGAEELGPAEVELGLWHPTNTCKHAEPRPIQPLQPTAIPVIPILACATLVLSCHHKTTNLFSHDLLSGRRQIPPAASDRPRRIRISNHTMRPLALRPGHHRHQAQMLPRVLRLHQLS